MKPNFKQGQCALPANILHPKRWRILLSRYLLLTMLTSAQANALADELDSYRYELEMGQQREVCKHMRTVYNRNFRTPWDFQGISIKTPPFPRLPGTEYDESMALKLRFSAFPSSPEFDAIPWKEGRYAWTPTGSEAAPMLVAIVDVDNDGKDDVLVKISFMLSFWPGGGGSPGGEDQLFIFERNQLDLSQIPTLKDFYTGASTRRPAMLSYRALGMPARSIRPFIYKGVTYFSVYTQYAISHPKRRRESMWILKYQQGGENLGDGSWAPVQAARLCRFRMNVIN